MDITDDKSALLKATIKKVIGHSGHDNENLPLIVFYGCQLPNPEILDHTLLLDEILIYLDDYVEQDFTLIMFLAGTIYKPSWSFLLTAYSKLSRKYKKNLKNLLIVHPGFWVKLIMEVMNRIVSVKFARKLAWIQTLNDLSQYTNLSQLNIPKPIYDYDLTLKPAKLRIGSRSFKRDGLIFGRSLVELLGKNAEKDLPKMLVDCDTLLREKGCNEEGIFRISPSAKKLQKIKEAYDKDRFVDIETVDLSVAASLIKVFLRDLADPLIVPELYPLIQDLQLDSDNQTQTLETIRTKFLPKLDKPRLKILDYLLNILHTISKNSETNLMTCKNLAIVMSPNLVKSENPVLDMALCAAGGNGVGALMMLMIELYPELEGDIKAAL